MIEIITSPDTKWEIKRETRMSRMCPVCANQNTLLREEEFKTLGFIKHRYQKRELRYCWDCETTFRTEWRTCNECDLKKQVIKRPQMSDEDYYLSELDEDLKRLAAQREKL